MHDHVVEMDSRHVMGLKPQLSYEMNRWLTPTPLDSHELGAEAIIGRVAGDRWMPHSENHDLV